MGERKANKQRFAPKISAKIVGDHISFLRFGVTVALLLILSFSRYIDLGLHICRLVGNQRLKRGAKDESVEGIGNENAVLRHNAHGRQAEVG